MRWYWLSCPQCGWKAQQAVDEQTAKRFIEEVQYCRDCDAAGKPRSPYKAREIITSIPKGRN